MTTAIAVALAASCLLLLLVRMRARLRIRHLQMAAELEDRFFQSARNIVDDDEAPEVVVEAVRRAGLMIDDPGACRRMLKVLWSRQFQELARREPASFAVLRDAAESMPQRLRDDFVMTMVTSVLSLTFHGGVLGSLLRRTMFWRVSQKCGTGAGDARDAIVMITDFRNFGGGGVSHA